MPSILLIQGAWWGLMAGLLIGVIRMALGMAYQGIDCGDTGEDTRPPVLAKVHYLHFAIILALCSLFVVMAVSLLTQPRKPEQVLLCMISEY